MLKLKRVERFSNKEKVLRELELKLFNSVKKNVSFEDNFGIAFSGGVDSSLLAFICKKLKLNFKVYTASINESEDLEWAKKVSSNLKLQHSTRVIDFDSSYEIIKNVCRLLKTDNPVQVGIGCTLYSVLEQAKNDKVEIMMTGLGSDSLFCGFNKHKKALENDKIEEQFLEGMDNVYDVDVKRDFTIASHFKVELALPYLEKEFMEFSKKIHPKLKINKVHNKIILRELAFKLGLKRDFAFRKKLAAQYGSGFDKAIEVLAKENMFKTKTEFLNSLLKK